MTQAVDSGSSVYPAPAKINLFLHVVGRRADGYHLIQSAMQLIDLADELTIVVRDDGVIARDGSIEGVAEADDLTIRAARLLQAASACPLGATIGIHKCIPMGGGLGGGSSDAATTLLVLNRLWRLDWSRARLMELGLGLGADVPFFIGGGDAFVEGIGERVTPITLPEAHYAVIHPGVAVPTVVIFTAPELTRDSEAIKILDFSKNGLGVAPKSMGARGDANAGAGTDASGDASAATGDNGVFRNDLEVVATARFDAVREALSWLAGNADGRATEDDWIGACGPARMSGSGACVFRAFDSAEHAAACIAALPRQWSGWSVRSLAAHPLRSCADD